MLVRGAFHARRPGQEQRRHERGDDECDRDPERRAEREMQVDPLFRVRRHGRDRLAGSERVEHGAGVADVERGGVELVADGELHRAHDGHVAHADADRGVEVVLSTVNIEQGDFTWTTDINWAANKEEIVELLNGKEDMLAQRWFIGEPLQVYYQYDNDGIWQNTAEDLEEMAKFNANGHRFYPGTIKVVDQNGDGKISADGDRVLQGHHHDFPEWTGSLSNRLSYGAFDLSALATANSMRSCASV